MSSLIRSTGELRKTLGQKLAEFKVALAADAIALHLYDLERDRLFFPIGVGLIEEERFTKSMPAMERVAGKIVHSRKPVIAQDAEHDPNVTGPFTHIERVKSAAGFPILAHNTSEVLGTVFVNYRQSHTFEKTEIEQIVSWLVSIAEVISQALEGDQGLILRESLRAETDLRLEEVRFQEVVDQLWQVLGDADIALWLRQRGESKLRIRVNAGLDDDFAARVSANIDAETSNMVSAAFVAGEEVNIKNPKSAPAARFDVPSPVVWKRMIAVPVKSEHHRLGVLTVFRREQSSFTRREQDLIKAFANLMAVTIENEERIVTLNALHDVGVYLTLTTDLHEILQEVARSACQVIGADIATVHLYDPGKQEFYGLEQAAVFPETARGGMEKPHSSGGLSARIIEGGRIYCENVAPVADTEETVLNTFIRNQEIRAYVGTPLVSTGKPLGVLYLNFREPRSFPAEDLSLIQMLANYASTAIFRTALLEQRTAVSKIAREITTKLDREELLQTILEQSLRLLRCTEGSIALYDRLTDELVFQYTKGKPKLRRRMGEGLMGASAQLRRPVRVDDVAKDSRYVSDVGATRSELDVPLLVGDKLIGVLNAESPRYNAFNEEDERVAMTLASQAAVALYNATLFEQRRVLQNIARDITSVLKPGELFNNRILQGLLDLLRCPVGTIALKNKTTGELVFEYAIGKEVGTRLPVDKGLMTAAAETMKPVRVNDVTKDARYIKHAEGTRSELDVPLMVGSELVGVLNVESPYPDAFSEDDERLAVALANQAAVAIYNATLFQERGALVDFGRVITSRIRLKEDEVLEEIYRHASQLMDTGNMYIAMYDESIDTVRFGLVFVNGTRVDIEHELRWQPRKAGKGRTEEIIHAKKPLFHATRAEAEAWYDQPEHKEYVKSTFASWIGVPMLVGEKVLGVIATYHPDRDHVYNGDDLEILQAMASQTAVSLDNAHLFYDVDHRRQALVQFAQIITSGIRLKENEILEEIYRHASQLMDTGNMYIAMYNASLETVRFGLAFINGERVDIENESGWQPRKAGKGRTEEIIRTKSPLFHATQAEAEAWYAQPEHKAAVPRISSSWMGVPMLVGEKVLGVIATYHPTRGYVYSGDDLEILQAMASQAAVALDNARLYQELKEEQDRRAAAEAWQTLGQAAANLAHRMNNVAGIIPVCIQVLRELVPLEPDISENLDTIESQTKIILRDSEGLLKPFGPSITGVFDVNKLIQEAIAVAQPMLEKTKVRTTLQLSRELPRIRIEQLLSEAFLELITNAIKAMPNGGELTVESKLSQDGEVIEVCLTDTGCGIPPDKQSGLFQLLGKRVGQSQGAIYQGTGAGFGLWWIKTFLQRWKADVILEHSEIGRGSTFVVKLLVKEA